MEPSKVDAVILKTEPDKPISGSGIREKSRAVGATAG